MRVLNTNATTDDNLRSSGSDAADTYDEGRTPATEVSEGDAGALGQGAELRLLRLEKNGDALLRGIMPLLEIMTHTLAEIRRDSAGREMSTKLLDSALAAVSAPPVESRRRSASLQAPQSTVTN